MVFTSVDTYVVRKLGHFSKDGYIASSKIGASSEIESTSEIALSQKYRIAGHLKN